MPSLPLPAAAPEDAQVQYPQVHPRLVCDDGNALAFCSTCAFSQVCVAQGLNKGELRDLHMLIEHVGPLHAGEQAFRQGDAFTAIAAVRAGMIKTCTVGRDGREHVLGFHLPGELVGLDAIDDMRYPCSAVALNTVMLCRFSFEGISRLAGRLPALQQQLFRLLSRDLGMAERLAGDWTADQRLAAFLLGLSRRLQARGFARDRFELTMGRGDIANYLRLAPETISRVLKRFEVDGLLHVHRRDLRLLDYERLHDLGSVVLDV